MQTNNEQNLDVKIQQLHAAIKQKNEIITHLSTRMKNQEKQIDMLVSDAQQKHHHQICKYYTKTYEKYMKFGKFLLLRIDQATTNYIFLPKYAKIVHFGELQVLKNAKIDIDTNLNVSNGKKYQENKIDKQSQEEGTQSKQLKQLNINNKENKNLQNSCKGLSQQIETLKQKLKTYASIVSQNKVQKIESLPNPNLLAIDHPTIQIKQVESEVKTIPQTPSKNQKYNLIAQIAPQKKQQNHRYLVSDFPSPSPIKRKNNKTVFIRKR